MAPDMEADSHQGAELISWLGQNGFWYGWNGFIFIGVDLDSVDQMAQQGVELASGPWS